MPHFDTLKIYMYIAVENIVRKREIACNKQFLIFSQCFLAYVALIFHFKCIFRMSSAIGFKLDQSKILSSGNGLRNSTGQKEEKGHGFTGTMEIFSISVIKLVKLLFILLPHNTYWNHVVLLILRKVVETVWENMKMLVISIFYPFNIS